MKTTSIAVMFFFSKVSLRKYLITAMFKVLYQQLRGTLTTAFERHLTIKDFTNIGCQACTKTFNLLSYYCFSFSQASLVFKFNLTLILNFIQYLYAFFIRTSKIFMSLNIVFCEGLQV